MHAVRQTLIALTALAACSFAAAAPVSLGAASAYNLVSFGDFRTASASIGGAVAVAGNVQTSSMQINGSNRAVDGRALVVGGDLKASNGSIANGNAYVGGARSADQSLNLPGQWTGGTSPLVFASLEQQMQTLSDALAGLTATGSSLTQWGGLTITGSNSAVEIFNFSADALANVGWASFSNLQYGSTLILNIGGTSASLGNGLLGGLGNYNVLYNFHEAESLSLNGIGIEGSILAPDATVHGGNASINGNVVVGGWDVTSIGVSNGRGFNPVDVAGYAPPPVPGDRPSADAPAVGTVPEPGSIALLTVALGLMAWSTRRKAAQR